jgi:hypothetical protein
MANLIGKAMRQNIPFDLLACDRTSSRAVLGWCDFMFRQEPKSGLTSGSPKSSCSRRIL